MDMDMGQGMAKDMDMAKGMAKVIAKDMGKDMAKDMAKDIAQEPGILPCIDHLQSEARSKIAPLVLTLRAGYLNEVRRCVTKPRSKPSLIWQTLTFELSVYCKHCQGTD